MLTNPVVSREEWLEARKALLVQEKEETRRRDKIRAARQNLPWVRIDKAYTFDTPTGKKTLADLFDGRSQLMIYHFMFGPDWEAGCPGCSFLADHIDGTLAHLNHHDVTFVAVSRAPLAKIEAYKKRMGWQFDLVSSYGSDFNFDYHVSFTKEELTSGEIYYNYETIDGKDGFDELPGVSVFFKDDAGDIFHTYSAYARGVDILIGAHNFLDLTPKGRNETEIMDWVKRHDEYESAGNAPSCCHS